MSQEEHHEKKPKRRLRFLFDLNLTRMGMSRLTVLQSSRFDLIMHQNTIEPADAKSDETTLRRCSRESNLTGDLSFQFKPENWVDFYNL